MKQIALRLPDELAAAVDRAAPRGERNGWIVEAIAARLAPAVESHSDLRARVKRRTVGDVLEARGGHSIGAVADTAPPSREHRLACKCAVCVAVRGKAGHP